VPESKGGSRDRRAKEMVHRRPLLLSPLLALTVLSGCSFGSVVMPRPFALSRAHPEVVTPPGPGEMRGFIPWAAGMSYLILINKDTRELGLYRSGERIRVYPIVLGRNMGRKHFEGDRRTPSGLYRITSKRKHRKYDRFLDLNYPNEDDLASFQASLAQGLIPPARIRPGRLIGIHGTDKEDLNRLGVNWTFGCVSLLNPHIEELYELVPEGTPVLIHDGETPPPLKASDRKR
jgi:lipoprotein-anchoring transpeptidase ErfK/SrfK